MILLDIARMHTETLPMNAPPGDAWDASCTQEMWSKDSENTALLIRRTTVGPGQGLHAWLAGGIAHARLEDIAMLSAEARAIEEAIERGRNWSSLSGAMGPTAAFGRCSLPTVAVRSVDCHPGLESDSIAGYADDNLSERADAYVAAAAHAGTADLSTTAQHSQAQDMDWSHPPETVRMSPGIDSVSQQPEPDDCPHDDDEPETDLSPSPESEEQDRDLNSIANSTGDATASAALQPNTIASPQAPSTSTTVTGSIGTPSAATANASRFQCTIDGCNDTFVNNAKRRDHEIYSSKHGNTKVACERCGREISGYPSNVARHLKSCTSGQEDNSSA